jgi:hypothetical protein
VWIDTPLEVGKTWSQQTSFNGVSYGLYSEVTAHETITVPAGDFLAFCIHHVAYIGFDGVANYSEWYAENLGVVRVDWTGLEFIPMNDVYELSAAEVVGNESRSWGQIKSIFR